MTSKPALKKIVSNMAKTEFHKELEELLNKHSKENGSNTPDFVLAGFLSGCLAAFDGSVLIRDQYHRFNKKEDENVLESNRLEKEILNELFSKSADNQLLREGKISKEYFEKIEKLLNLRQRPNGGDFFIWGKSFRRFELVDKTV